MVVLIVFVALKTGVGCFAKFYVHAEFYENRPVCPTFITEGQTVTHVTTI